MNTNKPYNILVTGIGAIIGYGIIESLRISGIPCVITGTDIYEENYGKYISDYFEVAPRTDNPNYYNWLHDVCRKHQIDLIIPGIEQDLFGFNENRASLPANTVLSDNKIIQLAKDKYETYLFLKSLKTINVIPTYTGLDFDSAVKELGLPFIIKPRKSYASKGYHLIRTAEDYNAVKGEISADTLFQTHIGSADEEYTFSVFSKGNGEIFDQMILRRYLSKEGATQKAYVVAKDDELQLYVDTLVKELQPIGPTNFQFRKQDGNAYLLEINPRISSACSVRSKFGYNEPKYCIEYYLEGGDCKPQEKKAGKAIRYISDKIIYE